MNTIMRAYPRLLFNMLPIAMAVSLMYCAGPQEKGLDVDEVQAHADDLEAQLEQMQIALENRKLVRAQEIFEEINENMQKNRKQLSAYPEYGLLKDQVQEVHSDLCYERVNVNLEDFYKALRTRDTEKARDQLSVSQEEFIRCKSWIESRSDFIALRMNLKGAPMALEELKRKIIKENRLKNIQNLQKQISSKMDEVRKMLADCEKSPQDKDLANEVQEELQDIKSEIKSVKEYKNDPVWVSFAVSARKNLNRFDKQGLTCSRRIELSQVAQLVAAEAETKYIEATKTKEFQQAQELLKEARVVYKQCEQRAVKVLKIEPGLSRYLVDYQGKKMRAAWLVRFCKQRQPQAQRSIAKARFRSIQNFKRHISSEVGKVKKMLAECEKSPQDEDLAEDVREEVQDIKSEIGSVKQYKNDPSWTSFVASSRKHLSRLDKQGLSCNRKIELSKVAQLVVDEAEAKFIEAAKTKEFEQAQELYKESRDVYKQCQQKVVKLLKAEPRLSRFLVAFKSKRIRVAWLLKSCKLKQREAQKRIRRLGIKMARKRKRAKK